MKTHYRACIVDKSIAALRESYISAYVLTKYIPWLTSAVAVLNYANYEEMCNHFSEIKWSDVRNPVTS
jgi:hypothetical protein